LSAITRSSSASQELGEGDVGLHLVGGELDRLLGGREGLERLIGPHEPLRQLRPQEGRVGIPLERLLQERHRLAESSGVHEHLCGREVVVGVGLRIARHQGEAAGRGVVLATGGGAPRDRRAPRGGEQQEQQ
jgi:hypothetical protein